MFDENLDIHGRQRLCESIRKVLLDQLTLVCLGILGDNRFSA